MRFLRLCNEGGRGLSERIGIKPSQGGAGFRWVGAGLVSLALTMCLVGQGESEEAKVSGVVVLFEKQCYSCHNIGGGDKKGPDLMNITQRREREWLHRFIVSPKGLKRAGDRTAAELFSKYAPEVMDDQMLSAEQIDQILDMIQELSQKNETFIPQSGRLSRAPVAEDIPAGQMLFTGGRKLGQQGPACIFCHSLAGAGYLGGGTLGPDLTQANLKYKDVELASILKAPGLPTMSKVYGEHELSDEEVVQLFSFLRSVRGRAPEEARSAFRFYLSSVAGAVALLGMTSFVWRGRLRGVRRQLRRRGR